MPSHSPSMWHLVEAAFRVQRRSKMMALVTVVVVIGLLINFTSLYDTLAASSSGRLTDESHRLMATSRWNQTRAGVPMILHFVYRDTNVLEPYRANIARCLELNPNWTVVLWTDASAKLFLAREFPNHKTVFHQFKYKIQRSDAIRYVVLYRFGGVYMDLDMLCHQPLLTSLSDIPCFLDKGREYISEPHGIASYVMNSAMGCTPRHPFFKLMTDTVLHPQMLNNGSPFPHDVFETTGPAILTKVHERWAASKSKPPVTVLGQTYFSPRMDILIYHQCRDIVKALGQRRKRLYTRESSCLELEKLGYEKSDDLYITNLTVAIHQFTHLGYNYQLKWTFNILKVFPRVMIYDDPAAQAFETESGP